MERSEQKSVHDILTQNNAFLLAMLGAESRRKFTEASQELDMGWQGQNVITALCVFAKYEAVSQRQLADFVCIDPRNLVTVIDNLEQRELLRRMPNPNDRRGHQLQITDKGKQIALRIQAIRTELEADMLTGLTDEEKRGLHSLLKKIWESMDLFAGFRGGKKPLHGEAKEGSDMR